MVFSKEQANKVILCIILSIIAILGVYQYSIRDYVKVEATITGKGSEIGGKTHNTSTYVYYEYVVDGVYATGKVLTIFQSVYHVGDTEIIWVNPNQPKEIASKEGQRVLLGLLGISVIMFVANIRQGRRIGS